MSTVAFIGLGAMGSRMATNLHAAGHELKVFNRNKEKTRPFADKGIKVFDSPAAAAKGFVFSLFLLKTFNSCPAACRFTAMREPIAPKPMNATVLMNRSPGIRSCQT